MSFTKQCAGDEQLRAYLTGNAKDQLDSSIEAHLQNCEYCQNRLESLTGNNHWWNEAEAMLADYIPSGGFLTNTEGQNQASPTRLSGIETHLSNWMGPTDDPTKMGRIGSYEILGVIGFGGAGVVLRAHDNRLNRPVAIKALLPALAHNPMARRRFERESRAVAAIVHQNVVPIYAVDTYKDHPFIAMYYVGGRSLQQRISQEGALQVAEIVRISKQIADALEAAHSQGVIHRDIKPANILLESNVERVYVTDFGLARVADDASTHSGTVTGTPQFMSPEQCFGANIDQRTDLFSLGSVMYAMCTGRAPFRSETLIGMLRKVCDVDPKSIREINPDIPQWLKSFVFRLMSKRAEDRFETAGEVSKFLDSELAHLNSPTTVPCPARPWQPETCTETSQGFSGRNQVLSKSKSVSFSKGYQLMIGSTFTIAAAILLGVLQSGGVDSPPDQQKSGAVVKKKVETSLPNASGKGSGSVSGFTGKSTAPASSNKKPTKKYVTGSSGQPGELITIEVDFPESNLDGYTLYLPSSYEKEKSSFPVIVYLQGGLGVGGEISKVNEWGIPKLVQQNHSNKELDQLIKDQFIIVSPHIQKGQYYSNVDAMKKMLKEIFTKYKADRTRVYLTGLSRGGCGTWGLAWRMPGTFAAIAPIASNVHRVDDYKPLLNTPTWIAHNKGDQIFSYSKIDKMVRKLEEQGKAKFLRINALISKDDKYLEHPNVLISADSQMHDAWTDVYSDTSIYKWMLKHRLSSKKKGAR